jgi:multimeric flavodoxin WrbA
MDKGNTDKILQPFLEGTRTVGATAETLYIKKLKITPCQGCYSCHWHTPGECKMIDDMQHVLDKMFKADVVVFATPLYVFTVSTYMKAVMDRMMVLGDLKVEVVNGVTVHPARYPDKKWNCVIISNSGFPEQDHFSAMLDTFRRFARAIGGGEYVNISASICKGMGELMAVKPLIPSFSWFFEACRKAGREIVETQGVTPETMAVLNRPLMDISLEEFAELANVNIEKAAKIIREKSG